MTSTHRDKRNSVLNGLSENHQHSRIKMKFEIVFLISFFSLQDLEPFAWLFSFVLILSGLSVGCLHPTVGLFFFVFFLNFVSFYFTFWSSNYLFYFFRNSDFFALNIYQILEFFLNKCLKKLLKTSIYFQNLENHMTF